MDRMMVGQMDGQMHTWMDEGHFYSPPPPTLRDNKYPKYDAFLFDMVRDTRQNHWTMKYIGHSDQKKYEVTHSVKVNKNPKYDTALLDRARDIRQNHWTM